ncbi:hypothetical protein HDU93_006224 [Gonapodya sp. JEL0774]|nr:hypothetical protein HDU93_006224 [Gonapodya sp. JEL0774]
MEKKYDATYTSNKVLGRMYDEVVRAGSAEVERDSPPISERKPTLAPELLVDGYLDYIGDVVAVKAKYDSEITRVMKQYGVRKEWELVSGFLIKVAKCYRKHKKDYDIKLVIRELVEDIQDSIRLELMSEFGFDELDDISLDALKRSPQYTSICAKASACYYIAYGFTGDSSTELFTFPLCLGDVLCDILASKGTPNEAFSSFGSNSEEL